MDTQPLQAPTPSPAPAPAPAPAGPPLRVQQRLFEPQLSSALGWLLALTLALASIGASASPPEATGLCALVVAVLLALRIWGARAALGGFAFLVRDPLREGLHVAAAVLALVLAGAALTRAATWPACPPVESSSLALPRIGSFHLIDFAVALLLGSLTVLEPRLFRRSLAIQYLWPTTPAAYWIRWLMRIAAPSLIGLAALSLHALTATQLWGVALDVRAIAHEVVSLPTEAPLSGAASVELEDEQVIGELATLAMCQPDDELARALVWRMRAERVRIRAPKWRALEAYVYELESGND